MAVKKIKNLKQAEKYLYKLIQKDLMYPGDKGIERVKLILSRLDSPQNKLKVIHIAGTSGKGSTANILSDLLIRHKFKTGMHLSPHLLDIRERCLINNKLISEKKFVKYLNEVKNVLKEIKPTYFEFLVCLAYFIFYKEKVDYAIMETGLGGLYDGTNVINSPDKLCVISRIGYDHMHVLGNTLEEITLQKLGIVKEKNPVITISQDKRVMKTISKYCIKNMSGVIVAQPIKSDIVGYQRENYALASEVLKFISNRDSFKLKRLKPNLEFKGRFEIIEKNDRTLILDGAHNPQKMAAFIYSLKKVYPNKKFHFLFSVKKKKDYRAMLNIIIPIADHITLTSFFVDNQDLVHLSEDSNEIAKYLKHKKVSHNIITDPKRAIEIIKNDLVVTGSLYLLSEIYKTF